MEAFGVKGPGVAKGGRARQIGTGRKIMNPLEVKSCNGFVIYGENEKFQKVPIGIVSNNDERKALCRNYDIPERLKNYLIEIEDKRFYEHNGVDAKAVVRALLANLFEFKIVQGGSTITQQLARNLLKYNKKSLFRKVVESFIALRLEQEFSKDDILALYFNNVYWGKNIYGLRAASLEYFAKEPSQLSLQEQLALLTLLRGPNLYIKNDEMFKLRYLLLNNLLSQSKLISTKKARRNKSKKPQIEQSNLHVFKETIVPFIGKKVDAGKAAIDTSINTHLQKDLFNFVSNGSYPTSIVCIHNGKVVGVASSKGNDYPFIFRSNVGSCLKPILYEFLRERGIGGDDRISTRNLIEHKWNVREVQEIEAAYLTLNDALLLSNNNVFVNASYKVGIEETLQYLSRALEKSMDNLYPASILGATVDGISLYELTHLYYSFFSKNSNSIVKNECKILLNQLSKEKLDIDFDNSFFKTGTTNNNKERFAIFGNKIFSIGFLRENYLVNDYSKEGNFLSSIREFLHRIITKKYKWY